MISATWSQAITEKLIRRHPHVFGDERSQTPQAVEGLWERIKAQEKAARRPAPSEGALAGVPVALPALTRALKLQAKAGRVGFDWNDPRAVLRKIREEADEIEAALDGDGSDAAAEVGDLLFAAVNLARHLRADPEALLRQTNQKFERRFAAIEHALAARGKKPQDATLAEMDALWEEAKARSRRLRVIAVVKPGDGALKTSPAPRSPYPASARTVMAIRPVSLSAVLRITSV